MSIVYEETILAWWSQLCFSGPYRHRMCLMWLLIFVKVVSGVELSNLNWCLPFDESWDARQQKPSSSQSATDHVVVWFYWRPEWTQTALKVALRTLALQPLLMATMPLHAHFCSIGMVKNRASHDHDLPWFEQRERHGDWDCCFFLLQTSSQALGTNPSILHLEGLWEPLLLLLT